MKSILVYTYGDP